MFKKARRAQKSFICHQRFRDQRYEFTKYIKENNIKGEQIFFTDENRFYSHIKLNPQVIQIRLSKKMYEKLKRGKNEIREKIYKPIPKFPESFMVSGGISSKGPGKLIFCVCSMDPTMYQRAMETFKEDIEILDPNLIFQQDKASSHNSKVSKKFISENFPRTWPVDMWPANSPGTN
jgi:hypothetical protein